MGKQMVLELNCHASLFKMKVTPLFVKKIKAIPVLGERESSSLTPFAIERVASTSLNGAAEVNSKSYQSHYPAAFGPSFSLRFQDFFN